MLRLKDTDTNTDIDTWIVMHVTNNINIRKVTCMTFNLADPVSLDDTMCSSLCLQASNEALEVLCPICELFLGLCVTVASY